ncbi:MAG: hypothetical protein MMC23_008548 [Stictis urceolatum]|nr:hypothetical protein [Stictis urceolata]
MLSPRLFNARLLFIAAGAFFIALFYIFHDSFDSARLRRSVGLKIQQPVHSPATSGHNNLDTALLDGDSSIRPLNDTEVDMYIRSILDPKDKTFERLQCPQNNLTRYEDLIPKKSNGARKYLFAFNLHENSAVLPRLMATTLQAIEFLGPESCAVSIMEGRSSDGTFQILEALASEFEALRVPYFLESSFIKPYGGDGGHRIERLSALRNLALEPMFNNRFEYRPDMRILFINDLQLCIEDILELLYQHEAQSATMSCTMDWNVNGDRFRDTWVARTMVGSLFLEITHDGAWDHARDLFYDDPATKKLYDDRDPFQVYACWNGAAIIDAEPFLEHGLRFRAQEDGRECGMGEPTYLCKDLWRLGERFSRIQVVPSVNVAYDTDEAVATKMHQGWVTDTIDTGEPPEELQTKKVLWTETPPGHVKCVRMGSFDDQYWVSPV